MYKRIHLFFVLLVAADDMYSQNNGLVNTSNSMHAKLQPVDLNAVFGRAVFGASVCR